MLTAYGEVLVNANAETYARMGLPGLISVDRLLKETKRLLTDEVPFLDKFGRCHWQKLPAIMRVNSDGQAEVVDGAVAAVRAILEAEMAFKFKAFDTQSGAFGERSFVHGEVAAITDYLFTIAQFAVLNHNVANMMTAHLVTLILKYCSGEILRDSSLVPHRILSIVSRSAFAVWPEASRVGRAMYSIWWRISIVLRNASRFHINRFSPVAEVFPFEPDDLWNELESLEDKAPIPDSNAFDEEIPVSVIICQTNK